ncbi:MAG: hypothetical protein ACM3MI_03700, partial [Clostridiales bacterium]
YVTQVLQDEEGIFLAASDYVQILADSISKYMPKPLNTLGTFGFGRSENRESLRDFFEVDAKHIVFAALNALAKEKKFKSSSLKKAMKDLGINPEKPNPLKA